MKLLLKHFTRLFAKAILYTGKFQRFLRGSPSANFEATWWSDIEDLVCLFTREGVVLKTRSQFTIPGGRRTFEIY